MGSSARHGGLRVSTAKQTEVCWDVRSSRGRLAGGAGSGVQAAGCLRTQTPVPFEPWDARERLARRVVVGSGGAVQGADSWDGWDSVVISER